MNTWPTLQAWTEFAAVLTLELLVLFAVAKLISLRLRSAPWQRAVWQMTLVAMLLALIGELNGVRGWLKPEAAEPSRSEPAREIRVTISQPENPIALPALWEQLGTTPKPSAVSANISGTAPRQRIAFWAGAIVLAVACILLLRVFTAQILTLAFRATSRRWRDAELTELLGRLSHLFGIRRRVTLARSLKVRAPFTFGVWRPVIVLPRDFKETFSPAQREVALAHELAHVAGFDSAWRTLANVLGALLWWNPFVWLAKRELDRTSELAADEAALHFSDGPDHLAECLLLCAQAPRSLPLTAWLGMDGGYFRSALGRRIARLLHLRAHDAPPRRVPKMFRFTAPPLLVLGLWMGIAAVAPPAIGKNDAWRNSILGSALAATIPETSKAETRPIAPRAKPQEDKPDDRYPNGTVASPKPLESPVLHTRFFSLTNSAIWREVIQQETRARETVHPADPPRAGQGGVGFLTEAPHGSTLISAVRDVFSKEGIDLTTPGKALFWNDRLNVLMVRATKEELDSVEKVLAVPAIEGRPETTPLQNMSKHDGARFGGRADSTLPALQTRFFKIDPSTFERGLRSLRGVAPQAQGGQKVFDEDVGTNSAIARFDAFMQRAGVDLHAPGRAAFMNDGTGELMVRASQLEMEIVERAVKLLTASPQQLTIRVKVLEVAQDEQNTALDWFIGTVLQTNSAPAGNTRTLGAGQLDVIRSEARSGTTSAPAPTITGILTDEQFRSVIRALESRGGTDLLSAPEITTMSGRQAQIKMVDVRYVVTDLDRAAEAPDKRVPSNGANTGGTTNAIFPVAEPFEIGPSVDIVPYVLADGRTIQLTVLPTLREFLGYDEPPKQTWATGGPFAPMDRNGVAIPLPKFRLRQAATTAVVRDGQTLVIGTGSAAHVSRDEANGTVTSTNKHLFFFVTPRLIDAAGNPLHSNEQLQQWHQSLPGPK